MEGTKKKQFIIQKKTKGRITELRFIFQDGSEQKIEIATNGTFSSSGAEKVMMSEWSYRRTILRQDEVAEFVNDSKGDKYSVLLPLLGLDEINNIAENIRKLIKSIEQNSKIREIEAKLEVVEQGRKTNFKGADNNKIAEEIEEIYKQYFSNNLSTNSVLEKINELSKMLESRSSQYNTEFSRYQILRNISQLGLAQNITLVRNINSNLACSIEPLILEKLNVLESTNLFISKLNGEKEIVCPACGQLIAANEFKLHVNSEKKRLKDISEIYSSRKIAIEKLIDDLKSLKSFLNKDEIKQWSEELKKDKFKNNFEYLESINFETLRSTLNEDSLCKFESLFFPIIAAANTDSKNAPHSVQKLFDDKQKIVAAESIFESIPCVEFVNHINELIRFLSTLEEAFKLKIKEQTNFVVNDISADIEGLWKIMNPEKTIDDVHLYLPENEERAIDIGLKFHGGDQLSPRLTLSEGYRNSLGLAIFLAMAKRDPDRDHPIFLDDVIVSLDRNHRGMLAGLLIKEFSDRQVIVFTHDREWYTELRQQLDGKDWVFKTLLPYETPEIGIRWSHKTSTFDDARVLIKDFPDSAGNDARKIMDVELSLISENLRINLPYLRGEKNDQRMAHDFLSNIVANGKKSFQIKNTDYTVYTDAINSFIQADKLIVSWANRASHTFDLVQSEAKLLIDTCETALEYFKCQKCGKNVWFADSKNCECVQCQCGNIRWNYGKK